MKSFLIGFIVVAGMFTLCMLIAYLFCVATQYKRKKNAPVKNDAKIYYITNIKEKTKPKAKPKPKKEKRLDIALKGSVINAEDFHKYFLADETKIIEKQKNSK